MAAANGILRLQALTTTKNYLNILTVSFAATKYSSGNIEFAACETAHMNFQPIQELDKERVRNSDSFNPDHIIPFLLIDGQFIQGSSGYSAWLLEGMDYSKVKGQNRA